MLLKLTLSLFFIIGLISCVNLERSPESGYSKSSPATTQSHSKTGLQYKDYRNGVPTQSRNESITDKSALESRLSSKSQKQLVRELERKLDTKKEKEQYSKVLPWFVSDEEKIDFLSLDNIEARQNWINKNRIMARASLSTSEIKDLISAQDIALGMPQEHVKKSWGDPQSVEVSGNPAYKNEKWKYIRYVASPEGHKMEKRIVYFEAGRVVGWETE